MQRSLMVCMRGYRTINQASALGLLVQNSGPRQYIEARTRFLYYPSMPALDNYSPLGNC